MSFSRVIRINSAACLLKPSRHPGRTVRCALNSKEAMAPPLASGRITNKSGELWVEMQFLFLSLSRHETAVDASSQVHYVARDCEIVHWRARNSPRFAVDHPAGCRGR